MISYLLLHHHVPSYFFHKQILKCTSNIGFNKQHSVKPSWLKNLHTKIEIVDTKMDITHILQVTKNILYEKVGDT